MSLMFIGVNKPNIFLQLFPYSQFRHYLFRLDVRFNFKHGVLFRWVAHVDDFTVEICGCVLWKHVLLVVLICIQQTLK